MIPRAAHSAMLLALAIVLAACARTAPDDGTPPADPTGVDWRLVELEGDSALAGPAEAPFIRFTAGDSLRVGGSTGCNSMGGTYEMTDDSLRFGRLIMTRRACADSAVNAQEARFVAALERTDAYRVEGGRLVLLAGSQPVARFERRAAP